MSAELIAGIAVAVFTAILGVNGWMAIMMLTVSKDVAVMKSQLDAGNQRFQDLETRVRELEKNR